MRTRAVVESNKDNSRTTLDGWQHSPLKGAKPIAAPDPGTIMEVTVILRPRKEIPGHDPFDSATRKKHMTHEQFAKHHCAAASDVAKISRFAEANQLKIAEDASHRRAIV